MKSDFYSGTAKDVPHQTQSGVSYVIMKISKTQTKKVIILKLDDVIMPNRERILQIAKQYGAQRVRVFGSVARGQDDANSDIDFLVDMDPGRSLFDLGGLLMDLEKLLNSKVDVVTERGLKDRIRDRVINEAVLL